MRFTIEELRATIGYRQLLVYGAGNQGRGITRTLIDQGFKTAGFVDKSPSLQQSSVSGLPVHPPEYLQKKDANDTFFVIISAFFFKHEIAEYLDSLGFPKDSGYISYNSLKPHDYVIEISGACNLRCIACPRADSHSTTRPPVMMSLENFRSVIAKIQREDPFIGNVQLYQWGEPTLNKNLPAMIRHARDNGILCGISSNLNHTADFRQLIASRPECLRISVSGTGDNYGITHTGGNWETFVSNVKTIAQLRRQIYPDMKVELYYHRYKHSIGKPQEQVAELCHEFGFEFHPVPAYLISLDDVLTYCEGKPLPALAQRARKMLLVDLDEGLERARQEITMECEAFRVLMINADLSVSTCMMYYYPIGNTISENFLETPLAEIIARRSKAPLCQKCKQHGIHRYCGVYAKISEKERCI